MMTTLEELSTLYKALGDPTRLRIVALLGDSELRVSEIVEALEMGQSRISRHLKILLEAGLLESRRSGVWTFYSIRESGPYAEIIASTRTLFAGENGDIERRDRLLAERRNETIRFFESRAAGWESMKRRIFGEIDPDRIVASLIGTAAHIADLGCGDGSLVDLLAESGSAVIGVDNAPAMIEYARRRRRDTRRVEFRLGDVEYLPLKDGEVEGAVLSLVLHHLPLPALAISEASRVIAPGGRLVVAEFAPHGDERFRELHGDRWLGIDADRVVEWLTQSSLELVEQRELELSEEKTIYCIVAKKT